MEILDQICVDIETLSSNPNAVIVSISGVKFSLKSDDIEKFSINISPKSCKEYGLHVNPDTVEWWKKQSPEAIKSWLHSPISLPDALEEFINFTGNDKYTRWHANGTNFDFPILHSAIIATGKSIPWSYWMLTDMRTMYWAGGLDIHNEPRVGTYHDGISDCLTQIKWLKKVLGLPCNL